MHRSSFHGLPNRDFRRGARSFMQAVTRSSDAGVAPVSPPAIGDEDIAATKDQSPPAAFCLPPSDYCLLPTAFCLLPTLLTHFIIINIMER